MSSSLPFHPSMLLGILALLASPNLAAPEDWPEWRGAGRLGVGATATTTPSSRAGSPRSSTSLGSTSSVAARPRWPSSTSSKYSTTRDDDTRPRALCCIFTAIWSVLLLEPMTIRETQHDVPGNLALKISIRSGSKPNRGMFSRLRSLLRRAENKWRTRKPIKIEWGIDFDDRKPSTLKMDLAPGEVRAVEKGRCRACWGRQAARHTSSRAEGFFDRHTIVGEDGAGAGSKYSVSKHLPGAGSALGGQTKTELDRDLP